MKPRRARPEYPVQPGLPERHVEQYPGGCGADKDKHMSVWTRLCSRPTGTRQSESVAPGDLGLTVDSGRLRALRSQAEKRDLPESRPEHRLRKLQWTARGFS